MCVFDAIKIHALLLQQTHLHYQFLTWVHIFSYSESSTVSIPKKSLISHHQNFDTEHISRLNKLKDRAEYDRNSNIDKNKKGIFFQEAEAYTKSELFHD